MSSEKQSRSESDGGEAQVRAVAPEVHAHKGLPPAATALPIGAFATTLTTLSLSLMEWRGVTTTNVYVANFFFVAALGLVISAQWELSVGNGFAYTVYSAFGFFYAGYAAILTPSFGIRATYGDDAAQYNNALGFFILLWTIFVFTFLVASIPTHIVNILIFFFVDLGFLAIAAAYFAKADGHATAATGLNKAGGVFCFLAGLVGWYLTFHLLLKDDLVELPLGDVSHYFRKWRAKRLGNSA
ncbi:Putative Acetate transporter [[Torrubiella] hemipterigena]|uniref:Putative Acetate transporter n=1 Tax=[Torrubiella] hemipterigena TaxID=1531966 RepID=A0A0A1T2F2_9HYPO|nr:Putative Acetate transporter [[Torrubiella] hemipterigena]